MAEPDTANNTHESRKERVVGRPFEPGNQLGKVSGGRPKGLARRVREAVEQNGGDQNTLVTIMVQHATGYRQMLHPTKKTKGGKPVEEWQEVTANEQQAAIRWLADRGYGKALEFVPIESDEELVTGPDINRLGDRFESALDELAARRRERRARDVSAAAEQ